MTIAARPPLGGGVAIALTATMLAGCGGAAKPSADVSATVDLTKATAGPTATTATDVFSFTGTVDPPDSTVTVSDGVVRVEPSGRFTVATAAPAAGTKRLRLHATRAGRRPWSLEVRISRGAPQRVRVPAEDDEAPSAALALQHGDGEIVVQASPSRAGEQAEVVRLAEPRFRAIATVRDSEGGTGRIRLSIEREERCDGTTRQTTRSLPPAQVVNVAIPPGAHAPVERQRTQLVELAPRQGCSVRGELLAEGTDAHGRQAVTAHIGFTYP